METEDLEERKSRGGSGGEEEEKRWMRKRRAGSGVGEVDEDRERRARRGGEGPLLSIIVFLIVGNGVIYNSWKRCMFIMIEFTVCSI